MDEISGKSWNEELETYFPKGKFQISEPESEEGVKKEIVYADKELERLETEAMAKRYDVQNLMFWEDILDLWVDNFTNNLPLIWSKGKNYKDIPNPKPNTPCVVLGASPSMTDKDLIKFKDWPGIKFCCNKSLIRCLKLGVVPDWLVTVHKTEQPILSHFDDPLVDEYKDQINVLTTTSIHPNVAKRLAEFKEIYWGNDIIDPRYYKNLTEMMVKISKNISAISSVGNVGTFMVIFANTLRCHPIGIYGIQFSISPNPKWSQEEANKYRYFYIPERDEFIAMGTGFSLYADLTDRGMKWAEEDKGYHTRFINLTPTGFLRLNGTEYMGVERFVKKFRKRKRMLL